MINSISRTAKECRIDNSMGRNSRFLTFPYYTYIKGVNDIRDDTVIKRWSLGLLVNARLQVMRSF